jgi:subtilisin family serine protease
VSGFLSWFFESLETNKGIQLNHPDLVGKLLPGYDFVNKDNSPDDGNGHGTHVAGIASSSNK